MTDQTNPPAPPDGSNNRAALVFMWLIVAFVPGAISVPLLGARHLFEWSPIAVLIIAAACCLCSAFGMLGGVKEQAVRIILGLLLAGAFFVLNMIIVVFVGCTTGRIPL